MECTRSIACSLQTLFVHLTKLIMPAVWISEVWCVVLSKEWILGAAHHSPSVQCWCAIGRDSFHFPGGPADGPDCLWKGLKRLRVGHQRRDSASSDSWYLSVTSVTS